MVYNCQHCDEQQFQTLSCVHYTIFSVVTLDLYIRALLLDRILTLEKTKRTPRVHLVLHVGAFLVRLSTYGSLFHHVSYDHCWLSNNALVLEPNYYYKMIICC